MDVFLLACSVAWGEGGEEGMCRPATQLNLATGNW